VRLFRGRISFHRQCIDSSNQINTANRAMAARRRGARPAPSCTDSYDPAKPIERWKRPPILAVTPVGVYFRSTPANLHASSFPDIPHHLFSSRHIAPRITRPGSDVARGMRDGDTQRRSGMAGRTRRLLVARTDGDRERAMNRPVRVVFDAHAISPRRSGIGEYSLRLCSALVEHMQDEIELHLYAAGAIRRVGSIDDIGAATARVADRSLYMLRHQIEIPRLLARGGYDLFHAPDFYTSVLPQPVPLVSTIHDVIPLVFAKELRHSRKSRFMPLFRLFLWMVVRRARTIVTVSAFSRTEIVRLLGADPRDIAVTLLAPTLVPSGDALPPALTQALRGRPYLLSVGRRDPYKGLSLMLEAFARARASGALGDMTIVITGPDDPRYPMAPQVERLQLREQVIETGYVDSSQLSAVYANAFAFVMPSLYEGFGMPPLDAMLHGVPVVCSMRSSLPEVVGDAALPVDPEDIEGFARALSTLAQDQALRERLRLGGLARAATFSWERTARETARVYRAVAERRVARMHTA
jgi:glycosyltransferase involved in cell wall biosynthesis